ncbi:MAG: hypothetical protein FWB83_08630 [Treponema sp.]|nr:hypothetical protein [Treponema sp.]
MDVLITGVINKFDEELAAAFVGGGYRVFAVGSEPLDGVTLIPSGLNEADRLREHTASIDLYIDVTDVRSPADCFNVRTGLDAGVIRGLYDANVIRPMEMLETFLPFLEAGGGKRLCFLTSAQASINETRYTGGYGYNMSKAALHNFLQITRNALAPKGYTMRVFDPCLSGETAADKITAELSAQAAFNYFVRRRGIERGDEKRDDEGTLVFRDAFGRQHTW